MAKLKFFIIGPETDNTADLVTEIESRGHQAVVQSLKNIILEYREGDFKIYTRSEDLLEYDIFIFRAFNIHTTEARIIARALINKQKIVIDESIGKEFITSKVFEANCLASSGLNHPRTIQVVNPALVETMLRGWKYPVVIKPIAGQKGQGIAKCDDIAAVISHFTNHPKGFFIQEYLPLKSDFRVMVVGENVIGAIERIVPKGDFRSNTSLGAKSIKAKLTSEMKEISLAATRALGYEMAGVDLAYCRDKWYVLEVNHTPQWQNVKKLCGVNPAAYIVDYAINKYQNDSNN